ncbi:MAG: ABC transporter ATP-binding protein [Propionibacteriaceae bacterium]
MTSATLPAPTGMQDAPAVQTRGLRKTYRTRRGLQVAVEGLDLYVPTGGVHGFLGPNGSGKTTTIRMLLGLIRADAGSMTVFGRPVPDQLPAVIGSIGAIVEQPKFFPAFTGRKNLVLLAQAIGAPKIRVDEVLDEVGLGDRGKDRFRSYSLGMRQRLAIAGTLLKSPELLIFDEPTNGLDPAGIHEIRATMRNLSGQGRTVLVSSHILSEVQQVADTVSIIGRGRLLAAGDVSEILARGAQESVRIRVAEGQRAADLLMAAGYAVQPGPDRTLLAQPPVRPADAPPAPFNPAHVTQLLAREGLFLSELTPIRADLEQVFLSLTAEEHLGARPVDQPYGGPPPPGSPPPTASSGPGGATGGAA